MKKIPQILMKNYLKHHDPQARLNQYNFLNQFNWIKPILEELKPELFPPEDYQEILELEKNVDKLHFNDLLYRQYRCITHNPLDCHLSQPKVTENLESKYCQECRFPMILRSATEIQGKRGRYKIEKFLNRRGLGRLYQGMQIPHNQVVVMKEYLLPDRCFNQEEAKLRKQAFEHLAGCNLADGRIHNFRFIESWDAIADPVEPRCYLITLGNLDSSLTLREYLRENGSLNQETVLKILAQVLQSLESLHGQKFSFPGGQLLSGIAHGNITLDTLLIGKIFDSAPANSNLNDSILETDFFIYLSDLSLWEHLFNPLPIESFSPTVADDLGALGRIAFYLLLGQEFNPNTGQIFKPEEDQQWPKVNLDVKRYILNLMGIGTSFANAEIARQAIPKLPPDILIDQSPEIKPEVKKKVKFYRGLWMILTGLGLAALGLIIWSLLGRFFQPNKGNSDVLLGAIADVSAIPPGKFIYTGEEDGIWTYILQQENLIAKGKTLAQELQKAQPKLNLSYQPEPSVEEAIAKIRAEKAEFLITSLTDNLSPDLDKQEIAYDGLLVFVDFSYVQRENGLTEALKGQITLRQLQQLYTGQITNWSQLGGPDLPVQLYIPDEAEAIQIFEQRVLQNERYIADFRKLLQQEQSPIIRLSTFDTLRRIIQDFESKKNGGIAFGTVSKVFGQCSVYPLAIGENDQPPVQALIQDNGIPVNPSTNLCNQKGNYHPNLQLFKTKTYPLAYNIAVVYPKDNSRPRVGAKFVELLRTKESQHLLTQAGLIPLQSWY